MEKRTERRKRIMFNWKWVAAYVGLVLAVVLVAYVLIANIAYYRPLPADLPCRSCTGEARSVHVDGFDLYYREVGSDRTQAPIVVVHGGPGHSSQSFKQSFDFLSNQSRVIYYDQRGSGNSQILPDNTAYTIEQLIQELETIRRDVIEAEQIRLVGHSAGGALVQRYALEYPEHVEQLVLVSSIRINNGVTLPLVWDRVIPALFLLGGRPPADARARDLWFAGLNEAGAASRLYDPMNTSLLADSGYLSFATWREVSRSLEGDDFKEELQNLSTPTLVMYGAADSTYTGEATASYLCELLPRCTLARFEHSGHWPFLEEPEQFQQVLRKFFGE